MSDRAELLKLHDWDELVFGGFYCVHCTPDDEYSLDDPIWWPCPPLRAAGVMDDEAREIIAAHRQKVADEYRSKQEAEKQEGQRKADEFNARYPIGTPVLAYPSVRPEHPVAVRYRQAVEAGRPRWTESDPCKRLMTRTRSKAWILGHGEPVVMVDGYAGGICLTHVDPFRATDTSPEAAAARHVPKNPHPLCRDFRPKPEPAEYWCAACGWNKPMHDDEARRVAIAEALKCLPAEVAA